MNDSASHARQWMAKAGNDLVAGQRLLAAGGPYDAMLHALFLGFVFAMIFGHAPIILPAVLGITVGFRRGFYAHLVLLHATLALRVAGDLLGWTPGRRWGGVLNVAALLLFAASRAQHVRHLIQPALAEGKVVLCDRFTDSTTAYQGYARGLDPDFIQRLNDYASCSCKPDITLLLDLDIADGFSRVTSRAECAPGQDRFEAEELSFHKRVREGFLKIAEKEPSRVKILNAKLPPEQVRAQIVEIVNDAFGPL